MTLNNNQKKAVEKIKGPTIVLAGAGTGKTYTIVEKVKHLVESGEYKPEEILCLTFSNEAANSLKNKIQEGLKSFKVPTVRTFHGFCLDILKEDSNLLNIDNGFDILLPDDAKVLMHRELNISPYWSNRYVSTISNAKDFGIEKVKIEEYFLKIKEHLAQNYDINNIDEIAKEKEFDLNTIHLEPNTKEIRAYKKEIKEFLELYKEYESFKEFLQVWDDFEQLKKDKNFLDYGDLNHFVLHLFRKFGADKYTDRYKHVIIDEFQDTNKVQFELIEHIAIDHKNITVVGDPNQSIYGFRGSYKESFNHFMKTYNATEKDEVKLEESHRSTNRILNIAHDLIKNNYENQEECFKTFNAEKHEGKKVKIIESVNMAEEARVIADIVEEKLKQGTIAKDICILFRTHRQGDYLKEYLSSRNIPLAQAGKTNLLNKREIKTTICYLSMLNNLVTRTATGEQGLWSLFHYKNFLSMEDSLKIGRYLKKNKDKSIDEILMFAIKELDLTQSSIKIIKNILSKIRELHKRSNLPLEELVLEIYEITGLNRAFSYQRTNENVEALMNLKKFYDIAKSFREFHGDNLNNFIDYLEVLRELGVSIDASEIKNDNAVRFMTIHASKGLEFETVIVSNLAEKRFPVSRTQNEPLIPKELLPDLKLYLEKKGELTDKEKEDVIKNYEKEMLLIEERRLAYVAFTRAKNELILTFARSYDKNPDSNEESIFLQEIGYDNWNSSEEKIENENLEYIKDEQELNTSVAPTSPKDKLLDILKKQIVESLDSDDINTILDNISQYRTVKEEKIVNLNKMSEKDLNNLIEKAKTNFSGLKFDKSMITLSPSALIDYSECPKKFELSRILQMPQKNQFSDDTDAASIGSFVHQVLEDGVNNKFKSEKEFLEHSKELMKKEEYEGMPQDEVETMIKVFWLRNKNKYNDKSQTEIGLSMELDGFKYFGLADRVDELEDGTLEIVDYKSNKSAVDTKKRNYQLGYYAIACRESMKREPSKLTLEMLKLDKPLEMFVEGNIVKGPDGRTKPFNLDELKEEFKMLANKIAKDFESEFKVSDNENACRFCGLKFYCPKYSED
ncbi:ATP-dependent helicase [Candidatus Woesearchaeota archaeon]|nr:ATP-dependent helicase [Candidatus Woesearchaeota archaeon]USN44939.1 MAG: ATP-dependent helicase [Candidatus Woesearchaeota archaeon]